MLAPVTHFISPVMIRRERLLQSPGKVLARKGQKVSATDVVAEGILSPSHLQLDVGRALGVSVEKADSLIQCTTGDRIEKGDVVAGPVGWMRRVLRAPKGGVVLLVGGGQVLVELDSQPFQLKAGMPGEVADLIPDRGVIIENTGALLQAVWGNGRIDFGLLSILARTPDHILEPEQLDVSLRGSVVLAGHCASAEALGAIDEIPLRGLILSSLAPSLIPIAEKLNAPVIVLEGFGSLPMNAIAHKLLSTNERNEVAINAEPWNRYKATRPEIIIPVPAPGSVASPKDGFVFEAGQQVRSFRAPCKGKIGQITRLKGSTVLPSGINAQAAEVRLENGDLVTLPLANLEVLA